MEMLSASLFQHQIPLDGEPVPVPAAIVAEHFRAHARGVTAVTAHERMKAFYRASANEWTERLG